MHSIFSRYRYRPFLTSDVQDFHSVDERKALVGILKASYVGAVTGGRYVFYR